MLVRNENIKLFAPPILPIGYSTGRTSLYGMEQICFMIGKICKCGNPQIKHKFLCRDCYNLYSRTKNLNKRIAAENYFIDGEKWLPCPGFERLYLISNFGRIKNINMRLLKPQLNLWGYHIISLPRTKTKKTYILHRLIAMAFIPNLENKPQINHKNGIKTDNRIDNLEWCTQSENQKHAYLTGLNKAPVGKNNRWCKYSDELVDQVLKCDLNDVQTAKLFKVSRGFVRDLRSGVNKRNPIPRPLLKKGQRNNCGYALILNP